MRSRSDPVLRVLLLAALLTAVSRAPAQEAQRGGVLRVALIGEPPTLDQHWTTAHNVGNIMHHVTEGLFALNGDLAPRPMLADRWFIAADRRLYRIGLRQGVRFHSGKELTSEDVVASLERWGRVASFGQIMFANVTAVVAVDRYTIEVKLREPYGLLVEQLAFPTQAAVIFPKEVVDEAAGGMIKRFIGTGPYRFVEHLPDRHIRLDRFEGYQSRVEAPDGATGRKRAFFDRIRFLPVPDAAVRVAGVQRGDYEFAENIPTDEQSRLQHHRGVVAIPGTVPWRLYAILNNRRGPMAETKIRKAFQTALDYRAILQGTFGSERFWRLEPSLMPKGTPMWTEAGKEHYNRNDPARAQRLLAEAGYRGEPIRWLTTMEFPHLGISAQIAKPALERAGFTIELQFTDWATLVQRRVRPELWDVFSAQGGFVPDPTFLVELQPTWPGWFDHPDMRAMLTLLRRHGRPSVRSAIWQRAQATWYEAAGSVKFGDFFPLHVRRPELQGYTFPHHHVFWNAWLGR